MRRREAVGRHGARRREARRQERRGGEEGPREEAADRQRRADHPYFKVFRRFHADRESVLFIGTSSVTTRTLLVNLPLIKGRLARSRRGDITTKMSKHTMCTRRIANCSPTLIFQVCSCSPALASSSSIICRSKAVGTLLCSFSSPPKLMLPTGTGSLQAARNCSTHSQKSVPQYTYSIKAL